MRCKACNDILEDFELTKKDHHGEFLDTCNDCLRSIYKAELCDDDYSMNDTRLLLDDLLP